MILSLSLVISDYSSADWREGGGQEQNAELIKKLEGKGKQLESDTLQEQQEEESWSLIGKDSVPTDQSLTEFGLVQRESSSLSLF